jgi:hypothetical protein
MHMSRSGRRALSIVFFVGLLLQSTLAGSSIVRGKLFRMTPQGQSYPASGLGVSVTNQKYGRSSMVYTGADGMFYLYNIPAGAFTLEVWTAKNQALRFPIQVYERPYTDINPIKVP